MSALHPAIRLPLWAILALPVAAYAYRSFTRGWDFALDMPQDLVVLGLYAFIVGAALWTRRARGPDQPDDHPYEQQHAEEGASTE